MRLIFATIVAAATLTALATPALADGERGRSYGDHQNNRGNDDHNRHNSYDNNRDNNRGNNRFESRFEQRHHGRDNRHDYRHNDNRGARYWGPTARQWSRWDNSWGDPHRFARQWGFDRYDQNRGWQRGNTWYANPSQWNDWGGWSWSFSVGNGGHGDTYQSNYNGGNSNCSIYRTQDWINGHRAIVTYQGCADRWGRVFEQPGTRRVERWGW
jgi:hypothetical protein